MTPARLVAASAILATAMMPTIASALAAEAAPVVTVAPGVQLVPGRFVPGEQPDGNSVVLRGGDGLVVFDTGRHAAHAQRIVDLAHANALPVLAIVNSHWHLDHVSGNVALRAAFPQAQVYASDAIEAAMGGFLARYRAQLVGAIGTSKDAAQVAAWRDEIARIDAGKALYPDVKVLQTGPQRLAGRNVVLHLAPHAATAADVWLEDPATRTVASGDLVTLPVPFLDTACPAGWKSALGDIALNDFTTLVPGHGAPMTHAQFDSYRRAFVNFVECGTSKRDRNQCVDGWLTDAQGLLGSEDKPNVKSMAAYYVDSVLRAKTTASCG